MAAAVLSSLGFLLRYDPIDRLIAQACIIHSGYSGLSYSLGQLTSSRVVVGMGSSGLGLLTTIIINGEIQVT